jgi:cytochrome c553
LRIAIFGICLTITLLAGAASSNQDSVNELMADLGNTMLRMLPAAYSEAPDRTLLLENLVRLEYLLKKAAPHFDAAKNGSDVTLSLLRKRLAEARQFGTRTNPAMLQRTVSDAFTLCASCHVQDGKVRQALGVSRLHELDEYLAVEYSFLTRDYAASLVSSKNYFNQEERSNRRDDIVLQRMLMIGVEVNRDFAATSKHLTEILPYLREADHNRSRVKDWLRVLTRLDGDKDPLQSPIANNLRQLDRFLSKEWPEIRTLLSYNEQEAYWVVIRGELNRHLMDQPPKRDLPQIYYWLAVTDRELQFRFYGSLSRAYLESCVVDFPKSPWAPRCLEEYEFLVLISFSGSAGTNIPPEVSERIEEMRKLLKQK